jgi:hypothetical protein
MIIKKHETIEAGQIVNKKVRHVVVMYEDDTYEQLRLPTFLQRFKPSAAPAEEAQRIKREISEEEEDDGNVKVGDKFYLIPSFKHRTFLREYYDLRRKNLGSLLLKHKISTLGLENMLRNYRLPRRETLMGAHVGKGSNKQYKLVEREVPPQKRKVGKNGARYSVDRSRTKRTNIKDDPVAVKKLIADFQDHSQKTPDICSKWDISPGQLYTILRANKIPTRNATIKVPVKKGSKKK